jgi:hypothetical protein
LLALTISFHQAARHIEQRRQLIYEPSVIDGRSTAILNQLALWSFPMALIATFMFATMNILEG